MRIHCRCTYPRDMDDTGSRTILGLGGAMRASNSKRKWSGRVTLAATMACATACTEFDPEQDFVAQGDQRLAVGGDVEVFSWWTSGGEQEALRALFEEHQTRVPNAEVTNAAVEFADKAREELGIRLSSGNPPDLFQANSGSDLFVWVETNGLDDSGSAVESLNDLSDALGWESAFDPDVLDAVTYAGTMYAVPLNVHRINSLFYRKDIFEEFDLEVPETVGDLVTFCERVMADEDIQARSPDGRMSCFGLGNKWDWTLSLLTFEMVFPAFAGPEFYESYFLGQETALPPQMLQTLSLVLKLYCGGDDSSDCLETTWFNPDVNERTWDEGVRKLSEEKALMAPMGDWAKGFLESEAGGSLVPGEQFDVVAFPGTAGTYVFTADSFTMPKGAPNRDGARSLLMTVGSKAGQIAFNQRKGSIPARDDISPSHFDEMQQATMDAFHDSTKVRALSGLLPGNARDPLHPELSASLRADGTEIMKRYLRANYPLD